ncbi:helix-turn-helix domain-containing protein [Halorientalis pallida]|uniref:Uncharacterized protein n=1 Tax=Halorientalis pallida TaxID=2479928 RepID=A0A498KY00_9EURY|nr:helix-turn-helix domain-containing protein [Halorientalis pallida]RXK50480.1 hypothetical protein EAF64_08005 [Halorientalis pallida]
MWEVAYAMRPQRGHFDRGERALWRAGVYQETVRSLEFLADGTVVIVYEIGGTERALEECLTAAPEKIVDAAVSQRSEPLVAQLRFYSDETFERLLSVHQSFGVSVDFPIQYVDHEPATVELVETGSQEALRNRIATTRELADVHVQHVRQHEPATRRQFRELTDRQREVLVAAVECGYYRNPREATHAEITAELGCSASVVGQHLRRIEQRLVSATVPGRLDDGAMRDANG